MPCPRCRHDNPPQAKFCLECGAHLAQTGGPGVPLALTVVGVALMMVSGWLGGEMVYVHRVGVEERPGRDLRRADRRAA